MIYHVIEHLIKGVCQPGDCNRGIDVRSTLVVGNVICTRMAVQMKKLKAKHRVQVPAAHQVRGSLGTREQSLTITSNDSSADARTESAGQRSVPVALMNGVQFMSLPATDQIRVTKQFQGILELSQAAILPTARGEYSA